MVLSILFSRPCAAGQQGDSPRKMEHDTVHASILLEADSQLVTGKTLCQNKSDPVYVNEVKILSPRTASNLPVRSSASYTADGERYRKRKTLKVPPTPPGYSVYKANANTMTVKEWVIHRAWNHMILEVAQHTHSMVACLPYLDTGKMADHIAGISYSPFTLKRHMRPEIWYSHLYDRAKLLFVAVMGGLGRIRAA